MIETPTENLFRGLHVAPELRDDTTDPDLITAPVMFGHFSRFDAWYEIDSWFEGRFLERTAPGSFKKTIRENRDTVKVQFDHGYDWNIGDSLLGPIDDLREDDQGPYFEVPLIDTDYNRERILPQLEGRLMTSGEKRGSLLGTSFRFRVTKDEWVEPDKASGHNPDKIPERTIREVRLFEFGPVVWPANQDADVGVRSLTDHYFEKELARSGRLSRAQRALTPSQGADLVSLPSEPAEPPAEALGLCGRSVIAARTQLVPLR